MTFKLNDSVVMKSGVKDPDLAICIEGWQGRLSEIDEDEQLVCIDWDSVTLKAMKGSIITKCEQEGLDWGRMYVLISDIEMTEPRDSRRDVTKAIDEIYKKYAWVGLGEEGIRIQKVLSGIDPDDTWTALEAWKKYLDKKLKFPIKAEVAELMERGPLRIGDKVVIRGIDEFIDETRGLFAQVMYAESRYELPLADLEVLDRKSKNYQPIKDYVVWYANR